MSISTSPADASAPTEACPCRELDLRLRLSERLAACFVDHREPRPIEHTVEQMLRQRIFGLVLGYEDLNDHEALSRDPLVATMLDKPDPLGQARRRRKDLGIGAISPSTLGRLERTKADADPTSRYDKIVCNFDALRDVFVDVFVETFKRAPSELVIDLDPSDIEIHGQQEGRFFHGYYDHHCFLPMCLIIRGDSGFCRGDHALV